MVSAQQRQHVTFSICYESEHVDDIASQDAHIEQARIETRCDFGMKGDKLPVASLKSQFYSDANGFRDSTNASDLYPGFVGLHVECLPDIGTQYGSIRTRVDQHCDAVPGATFGEYVSGQQRTDDAVFAPFP